jgi:tetratricopeptide (TPR) repeat protein
MKKLTLAVVAFFAVMGAYAQTLQDAQKEIDYENYFKAKQILLKLWADPATANKGDVAYYLGNAFLKSDDADSARIFYKLAYNPESRTPLGYVATGRVALLGKNKVEAKANFDRALQVTKMKNAQIYYEIGDAYFRPEIIDLPLAISNLEAAYNLDNKSTTILLSLGDAYLENSTTDPTMGGKAMSKYEAATDVNKNLAAAWVKQGRLAVRGRIYDQAVETYNKAIAIDPTYAIIYKELAEVYALKKDYAKVTPNFEKYLALSPGDNQARTVLSGLWFNMKEYDKAIEESKKGLAVDPNNYIFHRIVAFSSFELKRYKEGYESTKAFWALPVKKVKDIDYIYSARLASQVGDTAAANGYFITALANDSTNCDLLAEYAKSLYNAKDYKGSIARYNQKKQVCGSLASLDVYYLGRAYNSAGDSILADSTFAEFIQRNPGSPDGYFWRARVNLKLKKAEDFMAFPYYQKYIELASGDAQKNKRNLIEAYDYLGAYYLQKEDKENARTYFNKALELDPADAIAIELMKSL